MDQCHAEQKQECQITCINFPSLAKSIFFFHIDTQMDGW